jgi:signal transduction histidine kinase
VRVNLRRTPPSDELRHRIARLDGVPLRPTTARTLSVAPACLSDDELDPAPGPEGRSIFQLDPGWALGETRAVGRLEPLALLAETSWWPAVLASGPAGECISRLWRYSVAVSVAARAVAREAGDPDPDTVGRAGLLCKLGCWAVAAVDHDWIVRWSQDANALSRRQRELADLGTDLDDLGRRLAERWACEPLVVDAVWLHDTHGAALGAAAAEPSRLAYIQQACRWARHTPWSLAAGSSAEGIPAEPRLRILVAEVQARTSAAFVAPDTNPHEQQMTRQNARLRMMLASARRNRESVERFLKALADSDPALAPEDWAAQAARIWCAEPEVSAARVVWVESSSSHLTVNPPKEMTVSPNLEAAAESSTPDPSPPALVVPLQGRGRVRALVQLWSDHGPSDLRQRLDGRMARGGWEAWATMVADRSLLERRVQTVVASMRDRIETEEIQLAKRKLDALGEFAGGAGHELNNPLAVIVGRAQLLLARTADPDVARSLRIILNQAGRAHRILRDLIFVARPLAPRPRNCRPADLLRACLRDFQDECSARNIRLAAEIDDSIPVTACLDPDSLRHLADILVRNAIDATPAGGKILVRSTTDADELSWWFGDSGNGIAPLEAAHIFDPFFCGRQAGRGLGLGLPRAARIVEQARGRLRWTSNPGQGSTFQVHLPLSLPPDRVSQAPRPSSASAKTGDRPPKT